MDKKIWLLKKVLSCIALLTIASVSFAAESKLTELEGEGSLNDLDAVNRLAEGHFSPADLTKPEVIAARKSIFAPLEMRTTIDAAFARFAAKNPTIDAQALNVKFEKAVQTLQKHGLISTNEKEMISHVPSPDGY